ncbi:MAG: hypothetical protein WBE44_02015, partial [Terriglobales bacterium]
MRITVTLDSARAIFTSRTATVLNGGGGSFDFNFDKYLGLKAEFEGYGSNTQNFIAPAGTR